VCGIGEIKRKRQGTDTLFFLARARLVSGALSSSDELPESLSICIWCRCESCKMTCNNCEIFVSGRYRILCVARCTNKRLSHVNLCARLELSIGGGPYLTWESSASRLKIC
jgi:hypothetical protein